MIIKVYQAELSNTETDLCFTTQLCGSIEELNKVIKDKIDSHYRTYSFIEKYEITIKIENNKKVISYSTIKEL